MAYNVPEPLAETLKGMALTGFLPNPQIRVVDAAAPAGGSGTFAAPWRTFREAMDNRPPFVSDDPNTLDYVVLVAPGVYDPAPVDGYWGVQSFGTLTFIAFGGLVKLAHAGSFLLHVDCLPENVPDCPDTFSISFVTWVPGTLPATCDMASGSESFPGNLATIGNFGWEVQGEFRLANPAGFPGASAKTIVLHLHGVQAVGTSGAEWRGVNVDFAMTPTFAGTDAVVVAERCDLSRILFAATTAGTRSRLYVDRVSTSNLSFKGNDPARVSTVALDRSTVQVDSGALVEVSGNAVLSARDCRFAGSSGGAFSTTGGAKFGTFHNCRFDGAALSTGVVGGPSLGPFADCEFRSCSLTGNLALDGHTMWSVYNGGNAHASLIETVTELWTWSPPV